MTDIGERHQIYRGYSGRLIELEEAPTGIVYENLHLLLDVQEDLQPVLGINAGGGSLDLHGNHPLKTTVRGMWWPRTERTTARTALENVKALIVQGAMPTTFVASMGVLCGTEPFLCGIEPQATAAYQLKSESKWKEGWRLTRLLKRILSDIIFEVKQDRMLAV